MVPPSNTNNIALLPYGRKMHAAIIRNTPYDGGRPPVKFNMQACIWKATNIMSNNFQSGTLSVVGLVECTAVHSR
jgi:hypothetical protein